MSGLKQWITNGSKTPFYARKTAKVSKEVKKATAKVCGLGQFNFYINGEKVDDHILDPGWTDYRKIILYVTFDVTSYLKRGENVIGAEVGNGWFIKDDEHYTFTFPGFMPPNPNPYQPYGKSLVLAVSMEIEYEDGSWEVVQTDDTWKVKEHMVQHSNVYGSETIDGSKAQNGWNRQDFDDSGWEYAYIVPACEAPVGKLQNQSQPPIRIIKEYEGLYLHDFNNRKIYDFSQNMSGILSLEVKGEKGKVIKIYPAEKLTPEGDADQIAKEWVTVDSCITYIIGQENQWETCEMKFTYFAGRYIAVEGLTDEDTGRTEMRNLRAYAITSAYEQNGTFSCDDERYNQIYHMIEKTVEANMVSVHTDCPTIERFAWQEPNHLMAASIMYMKNGESLWRKFLQDMRVGQHTKEDYFYDFSGNKFYPGDGMMPGQAPCYIPNVLPVPGMGSFYDIIPWGSTCILGTYWHYMFYGDRSIIEENYDAGLRYFKYLKTKLNKDGFINHGLGDWGNPEEGALARENIETAFLYADAVVLMQFAEITGRKQDLIMLQRDAADIRDNYNKKLLVQHPEGFWCYRTWDHPDELYLTQAGQALPLYWGLVPEDKEEDIVKAFHYVLEEKGAFIAGEVGLPYVIQTARRYGMNDLICQYILKPEHPSYYAFILAGETTLGEYWEENPRSHCHDMMGHIIEWYYNGIAGIIPIEPGFKKIVIRPYLPETMNEFCCTYKTRYGEIRVKVKAKGNTVEAELKVPQEIEYTFDGRNLKTPSHTQVVILEKQGIQGVSYEKEGRMLLL